MYLFQPEKLLYQLRFFSYLHSTTYLFQPNCMRFSTSWLSIYIPLCIYFNYNANGGSGAPSSFTFHYVSISTFCFERTYHILHHLHSTMYLFQLHSRSFILISFIIYIPLCIYFNLLEGFALGLVLVFTFHYVSISTSGKTLSAVKRLVFTFHYFNFVCQLSHLHIFPIYIPLCIYFNL